MSTQQDSASTELVGHDSTADVPLRDDLLFGAKAIAAELGIGERRVFYLLESKHLPATKAGRIWVASRRRLRAYFAIDQT